MTELKTALQQICYIDFDSTEELCLFVKERNPEYPLPIFRNDRTVKIYPNGFMEINRFDYPKHEAFPVYNYKQLKK